MINILLKQQLDTDLEFVRSVLVEDKSDAVFLKHLVDGSQYVENLDLDGDLPNQVDDRHEYNVTHVLGILDESPIFSNVIEKVDLAHEYKWADGLYDKLQIATIAFIKATS